jgi:hypothetical protein
VSKHLSRTRVIVAGTDISSAVADAVLHRVPGQADTATLTVFVDRLGLDHDQTLTLHIAEGLID